MHLNAPIIIFRLRNNAIPDNKNDQSSVSAMEKTVLFEATDKHYHHGRASA
ncbi:hypothetical protein [Thalassospira alkalitolerans]|uniref:hypothetical protein n=1 Tax=Thalassospira alkalitolerans TaxID=1293890 RepID=UPI00146C87E0|nr:hypothetical protein [Thalassospira alkalitolerans]